MLLFIDPVLALFSLVTAPLLVAVSFVFRRKVRERARRQRRHEGDLASVASETLGAMQVVKAFGAEDHESERIRDRSEQRMGVGVEVARLQARFDGTVGVLRALATALVTVFGVIRVSKGELSAGDLIIFVSYTRKASSPMRSFAREASKLTAALARADRIAEILTTDDVLEDGSYRGPRATGEIELDDVTFAYAGERPALDAVSLKLHAGRRLALTGASGAGKSTLVRARRALLRPDRGPRHARRPRRQGLLAARGCASRSPSSCRTPSCSPAPCARTSPTAPKPPTRMSSRPPRPPPPTSSSGRSRTATTPSSARRAWACPADSDSGSGSPARCCAIRPCSSSTSPPRHLTPTARTWCSKAWTASCAAGPAC